MWPSQIRVWFGATGVGDALSRQRAYKVKFQEGLALFNAKPKKGIAFLQAEGMLGRSPEEVAVFFSKTEGLSKTMIGDYMGVFLTPLFLGFGPLTM